MNHPEMYLDYHIPKHSYEITQWMRETRLKLMKRFSSHYMIFVNFNEVKKNPKIKKKLIRVEVNSLHGSRLLEAELKGNPPRHAELYPTEEGKFYLAVLLELYRFKVGLHSELVKKIDLRGWHALLDDNTIIHGENLGRFKALPSNLRRRVKKLWVVVMGMRVHATKCFLQGTPLEYNFLIRKAIEADVGGVSDIRAALNGGSSVVDGHYIMKAIYEPGGRNLITRVYPNGEIETEYEEPKRVELEYEAEPSQGEEI